MGKPKVRKLQGIVLGIEKTGERREDEEGNVWEKCIFTVEITGFSKRTPDEVIPPELKGRRVELVRWCCFDWHYTLGVRKTFEPDETEAIIKNEPIDTVYW
ncbi:TPA: hypothetical protein EYP44_04890 [Candidatus Bathyarchaeota archaeon]|nr:hypothetical protein [Candidatus Bathyarchaeota archaeon]